MAVFVSPLNIADTLLLCVAAPDAAEVGTGKWTKGGGGETHLVFIEYLPYSFQHGHRTYIAPHHFHRSAEDQSSCILLLGSLKRFRNLPKAHG